MLLMGPGSTGHRPFSRTCQQLRGTSGDILKRNHQESTQMWGRQSNSSGIDSTADAHKPWSDFGDPAWTSVIMSLIPALMMVLTWLCSACKWKCLFSSTWRFVVWSVLMYIFYSCPMLTCACCLLSSYSLTNVIAMFINVLLNTKRNACYVVCFGHTASCIQLVTMHNRWCCDCSSQLNLYRQSWIGMYYVSSCNGLFHILLFLHW